MVKSFSAFNEYDRKIIFKLFLFHVLIGFLFFLVVSNGGGDAQKYWFIEFNKGQLKVTYNDIIETLKTNSATGYIWLFNYFPARILDVSFLVGNFIYSCLGFYGFLFFYAFIKETIPNIYDVSNYKLFNVLPVFPFILFLPNLHFWSSGIGKDTLLFLSVALFFYSFINFKKRLFYFLLSMLISILIRPHITLFLLLSVGLSYFVFGKIALYKRLFIGLIFIGVFVILLPYVQEFVKLESFDSESVSDFATTQAKNLDRQDVSSGIDTSNYPFLLKWFTFLYRPLFIDGLSPLNLLASIENLIFLIFSIIIFKANFIRRFKDADFLLKAIFVFFLVGSIIFSLILGNLGIMLRQKTPFEMVFLIFGLYVLQTKVIKVQ